ncbi:DUF4906 domain-containing protein [uncultured Bacteroides sp.]|uniref:DUF4906 domain-containing protein n=1 Tax=uncultured Bacteroides sp. TaxID=162156 RepID=UPI002AABC3BD|nr:DUF4906 domain-containing protein [uncultured Bacteroides sp.]
MIKRGVWELWFSFLCAWMVLFVLTCCTQDVPNGDSDAQSVQTALIRLDVRAENSNDISTRAVDESTIHDLHILVYNSSGELTGQSYQTSAPYTVRARSGTNCTIYAIANTGNASLFSGAIADTEAKLKALNTSISSWDEITNFGYLLMTGSKTVDIALGESTLTDGMTVSRLAAKVTLNVGISAGSGITLSGYRIYGLPVRSYYVSRPLSTEQSTTDTQTTRAEDASLPANASSWTNSGTLVLANVSSFNNTFYMYENRPGVNRAITVQSAKIKANAPAAPADSAAYVIIYGKAPGYTSLSWKIYLGANNTTNFNVKRNCQYTYNIILKPNDSDTRIIYNKVIWAGSNIYWDGTKLTFDTEVTTANNQKQGVCFRWGSLVGVSLSSTYVTYTPTYNSTTPTNSTWATGETTFSSIDYFDDDITNGGQTNTFLNDAVRNTDANYAAYKGDICKYLSKTGAVSGNWRMPTAEEFNAAGVADVVAVSWTTITAPWAKFGAFTAASSNAQGTTQISSGGMYTVNGNSSSFPASGYCNSSGTLLYVGQAGYCWSSSAYTGFTAGYYLSFYSISVSPANSYNRQLGFAVRCIQN